MKAMKTIVAVMAAAGLAMAQTPAASKPKAPASQTVSGSAATAPAQKAAPATTAPAKKAAPAKVPAKAPAKTAKKAVVTAVAKPSAVAPAAKPKASGKRDPFVNPVVRASGTSTGAMCSTGKRCLVINDMMLRGIVKTPNGMIAVVSNSANRAYFLKENDPIFNGTVIKITGDSVVFRENVVDNLGRESSREVVKRVNAPTV